MKIWTRRFNPYLTCLALGAALLAGCATSKSEKEDEKEDKKATTLELHLEVNPYEAKRYTQVELIRSSPITLTIEGTPFLTHSDIVRADIVDELGIWGIRLQFTQPHGARLLEYATSSYKGQRIAVHAAWGESRWLAAPQIVKRIDDGVFTFTPDASHEEIERIVLGLNNIGKEVQKLEK